MPADNSILTVAQLNSRLAMLIQSADFTRNVRVRGKLIKWSYFRAQDAYYFAVEDGSGTGKLEGVIFDQRSKTFPEGINIGMPVVIQGFVELYNKGGYHRIRAVSVVKDEEQDEEESFEERYKRLEKAGYFRQKRPLPAIPKKICIITSQDGDVIHDFVINIERRWPVVKILFIPAEVSTANAVKSLISALETANRTDADLILFGRGGGNKQEIDKVFNSVELAEAIVASRIPTVSAVGHEPNHTIADYAADKRVSTPTAAAEAAVPDKAAVLAELENRKKAVYVSLKRAVENKVAAVRLVSEKIKTRSPRQRLNADIQKLGSMSDRLKMQMEHIIETKRKDCDSRYSVIRMHAHSVVEKKEKALDSTLSVIDALSPLKVLQRGYSITYSGERAVRSTDDVNEGDKLRIRVSDGFVNAVAESMEKE